MDVVLSAATSAFAGAMTPDENAAATTIQKHARGSISRSSTTIDTMPKGGLRFPGSSANIARWGKLHADTPADITIKLLKTICTVKPSAVFSVVGNFAPNRDDSSHADDADEIVPFLRGLRTAAEKAGAWVTTRGLRSPAVSLVGRAMLGSKQPCIGFTPWHRVFDRKQMEGKKGQAVHAYPVGQSAARFKKNSGATTDATSRLSRRNTQGWGAARLKREQTQSLAPAPDGGEKTVPEWDGSPRDKAPLKSSSTINIGAAMQEIKSWNDDRGADDELLDACHSHFVFIDSALDNHVEVARKKRNEIEQQISNNDMSGDGIETPLVTVVLGGDPKSLWTLKEVRRALKMNNAVVVLAGSGGTADDICRIWLQQHEDLALETTDLSPLKFKETLEESDMSDDGDSKWLRTNEYRKVLEEVATLGKKTGYNTTPQMTLFNWEKIIDEEIAAEPTAALLERCLLEAATNNCKTRLDELLFSVRIGQPEILEHVLESGEPAITPERQKEERVEKALALEASLILGRTNLVSSLIDFGAEAALTFPELLFTKEIGEKYQKASDKKIGDVDSPESLWNDVKFEKPKEQPALLSSTGSITSLLRTERSSKASMRKITQDPVAAHHDAIKKAEQRSTYLKRLDRERNEENPQNHDWIHLLEHLVGGYDQYISVRCEGRKNGVKTTPATIGPTWIDLMLWACLAGQHDMTAVLWRKSRFPMRAALLSSTLCAKVAEFVDGEYQKQELLEQFERYEQWALDVLESCKNRQEAMGMLAVVPLFISEDGKAYPMFKNSLLDLAATEEAPNKKIVAHRHTQRLLDRFWRGATPGSYAALPEDTTWSSLIFQIFFWFVPGVLDLESYIEAGDEVVYQPRNPEPRNPEEDSVHSGSGKEPQQVSRSKTASLAAVEGIATTIKKGKKIIDNAAKKLEGLEHRERKRNQREDAKRTLDMINEHGSTPFPPKPKELNKIWEAEKVGMLQAILRYVAFNRIPWVRFILATMLNIVYMILPFCFLIYDWEFAGSRAPQQRGATDNRLPFTPTNAFADDYGRGVDGMPMVIGIFEFIFWLWTIAKLVYEFSTFLGEGTILESVNEYLESPFNILDLIQIVLVIVAALGLRLPCAYFWNDLEALQFWCADSDHAGFLDAERCESCHYMQIWARNLYAVVTVTVWARMFETIQVFESLGRMSIVLIRMIYKDVITFFGLVIVVSPGFSIAFAALQPKNFPSTSLSGPYVGSMFSELDSPFWVSFWGLLGEHDLEGFLEGTEGVYPSHVLLPFLLYIYLLLTTVVLVNLLIAQMSETYTSFLETAREEWAYRRASLIAEFKDDYDGKLPPPLNLITQSWDFLLFILRRLGQLVGLLKPRASNELDKRGFKLFAAVDYQDTLQRKEQAALEKAAAKQDQASAGKLDSLVQALHEQVKQTGIDISEKLSGAIERLESHVDKKIDEGIAKMKK